MTRYVVSPLLAVDELEIRGRAEVVARKRIVADDPYLSGHFPGRPIYPGVFVIESVLQAARHYLRGLDGDEVALAEIESARFIAPLFAGDVLTMSLVVSPAVSLVVSPAVSAAVSPVECRVDGSKVYTVDAHCTRRDGGPAARVILRCAAGGPLPARSAATPLAARPPAGVRLEGVRVPVRDLLPHRPPILLVDRVLTALPDVVVTERTVRPDDPCYRRCPSTVDIWRCAYPESLMLESLAQGGAVLFMLGREPGGTPVLGAVRQVRVHAPVFPGETMRHRVEVEHRGANTAIVTGTTWVGDRLCLSVGRLVAAVRGQRPAERALSG